MKSAEDMNSLPSPNAFASSALNDLAIILEEKNYSDYARKINECFSLNARDNPLSCLSLITSALSWKPVKKKPEPEPKPVPTDEELNREEPEITNETEQTEIDTKKSSRSSRRSLRAERNERNERNERSERAERRSARHRQSRH
jgi:uncharacterized protein YyaL (SSP411 family)